MAPFVTEGTGRVRVGLNDPSQLTFERAAAHTLTVTPALLTRTLNTGAAVVLQASNDIMINAPITVSAGGSGGALTLQAGRSIILVNASINTNNGDLTLIANDTLASGVVDGQRDPGQAVISIADGTTLNTGSGALTIELRDGAGRLNRTSGAIALRTVSAGSLSVLNNGPSPGSDVILGPVTTSGPQSYSNPRGITTVTGNLRAADQAITFTHSVVVHDGISVGSGADTVTFAGSGTQMLQTGNGVSFSNFAHTGSQDWSQLGCWRRRQRL